VRSLDGDHGDNLVKFGLNLGCAVGLILFFLLFCSLEACAFMQVICWVLDWIYMYIG